MVIRILARLVIFFVAIAAALWSIGWSPQRIVNDVVPRDVFPRQDIQHVRARVTPKLEKEFQEKGLQFGAPIYLRIFKEEAKLELWVEYGAEYALFKTYQICNFSGDLGPKLAEGDHQSPEGFYRVPKGALNPNSRFHLSFNLGYPNAYDRAQARTGSYLMVHGDCVSVGCYAMTDPAIEEIYVTVEAALRNGQAAVDVHAFPFRMTPARMAMAEGHAWEGFWTGLEPAYTQFEATKRVPKTQVISGAYRVASP